MFGRRWRLFRMLGIPIYVDASWLVIFVLVTLSLSQSFPRLMSEFYPDEAPHVEQGEYWIMAVVAALVFFVSILLHELGHAVVGRARGMPIRGITLFLFGGVAELGDEPVSAKDEFLMAVAGPLISLALSLGLGFLTIVGYNADWPYQIVLVLGYLASINAILLVFNMIPAFPLDGGRVLRSILWGATGNLRRATYWASLCGRGFAWLLIAWGLVQFLHGEWLGGIWSGLIAMFLMNAARSGYLQVIVREVLQGEPVRQFMTPEPIAVPPSLDLKRWVDDFVYRYHRKTFPVVADGHLEGVINTRALTEVPRQEWDRHTVGELMRHDLRAISIRPDADALQALRRMRRTGSSRLLVTDGDHLVGIISLKDLLRFLDLKLELENGEENGAGRNNEAP